MRKNRYKRFTALLKKIRTEKSMTQQEIAELIGVDRSTYTYCELGHIRPSFDFIFKISQVWNMDYRIFTETLKKDFDDSQNGKGVSI